MEYSLNMTGHQHLFLKSILFSGDGLETAAILLCTRRHGNRRCRLMVKEICPIIPQWYSSRTEHSITWSTDCLEHVIEKADSEGLSIIKVHSHPSGFPNFSATDDAGDNKLLPAIQDWIDDHLPHGSAVMLPNGHIFGRILKESAEWNPINLTMVVGDDIKIWVHDAPNADQGDFSPTDGQVFGRGTCETLSQLTAAVVGCSGTGSPVIEQAYRLGFKKIIIIDNDIVEMKNLNRILHTGVKHAENQTPKVEAVSAGLLQHGMATEIQAVNGKLESPEAVRIVAEADVVFGCMDSVVGRYVLNRIATYYTLPYFDIGVRLLADEDVGISEICGSIHYLKPGGSSLMSRGLFSIDDVSAEGLRSNDPAVFQNQLNEGYIKGVDVNSPTVISVNMLAASLAVNELLARLHPNRDESNERYASVTFSLTSMEFYPETDGDPCGLLQRHLGCGDTDPLVGMMELIEGEDDEADL